MALTRRLGVVASVNGSIVPAAVTDPVGPMIIPNGDGNVGADAALVILNDNVPPPTMMAETAV